MTAVPLSDETTCAPPNDALSAMGRLLVIAICRVDASIDGLEVKATIGKLDDFLSLPRPRHAFSPAPGLHRADRRLDESRELGIAKFADEFGQGHLHTVGKLHDSWITRKV